MKAVIQKVSQASVEVDNVCIGKIKQGLVVLLGIHQDDEDEDLHWLAKKIVQMRIFEDDDGKMNRSLLDIGGELLLISQFTLYASTKKGNRPSFMQSAPPEKGEMYYNKMCNHLNKLLPKPLQTGQFGAMMNVKLINQGPVTIVIDSKNKE